MLRISYEIMCDCEGCLDVEHLNAGAVTAKQMRDAAKKAGWVRRKLNGKVFDVCPKCIKKLEHALLRGSEFRAW